MNKAKMKTMKILLGVLIAVCVLAFAVSRIEVKKEEIKNSDEIILSIETGDVTALSWEYEDTALAFHTEDEGEGWQWDDDAAFPVNSSVIESLLEQFESFGVSFIIEDVTDYGQYGLDDPEAVITIVAGEESYEISLGDYSTMDEERYVSIGDGNVYLVSHDPMDDFTLTISDFILDDEIPALSEASSITFSGNEEYEITYTEDSTLSWCEDDVYFTGDDPLDTSLVTTYLDNISALSLSDYVSYNVTDEELKTYGLDTPELTVTIVYPAAEEDSEETHDETLVLHVSRNQEELAEAIESADTTTDTVEELAEALAAVSAYVRVGDSGIVYQITSDEYDQLMAASYDDLRHQKIMTASFDDVYRMDITLEGETYTLLSEEGDDDELLWYFADAAEAAQATAKAQVSAAEDESAEDADASDEAAEDAAAGDTADTAAENADGEAAEAAADTTAENAEADDTDDAAEAAAADDADREYVSVSDIQTAISSLRADSFTDEAAEGQEEIRFTLYLSYENHPQIETVLYRCDGSDCLAVVNDVPQALVARSLVVDLIEAVNALVLN